MDNIDKREKRAERKISSRYSGIGKSDAYRDGDSQAAFSNAPLWCEHGKMKDKCGDCKAEIYGFEEVIVSDKPTKEKCEHCQGIKFDITVKANHTQYACVGCKRVYCLFRGK